MKFLNSQQHKCPYCPNMCYGLQCKECHLKTKMLEKVCSICSKKYQTSFAISRRCVDCYNDFKKYSSICSCGKKFYNKMGYKSCPSCYENSSDLEVEISSEPEDISDGEDNLEKTIIKF